MVIDGLEILNEFSGIHRFGLMTLIGYSGVGRDLEHAYTPYALRSI